MTDLAARYGKPGARECASERGSPDGWDSPSHPSRIRPGDNCRAEDLTRGTFRFLGVERDLGFPPQSWDPGGHPDVSQLWLFHLHYLDYLQELHSVSGAEAVACQLVDSWIDAHALGEGDWWVAPWHPFVVATRAQSFVRFLASPSVCAVGGFRAKLLRSLHVHGGFLARHVEYDLLGNHLIRNLSGLALVGRVFAHTPEGRGWFLRAIDELADALDKQMLLDGGHEERSPMYHALVLQDLLDVLEVLPAADRALTELDRAARLRVASARERLCAVGLRMAAWLEAICHADGDIPLFNDSVLLGEGVARLIDRVRALLPGFEGRGPDSLALAESGYFWLRAAGAACIVDCGPVAAPCQPAHAHCDLLSYELSVGPRRIVVDSGVYEYQEGPARDWARSTLAHNTVVIDGREQSEMWKSFRVGRRARPLDASLEVLADGTRFRGAHDGYRRAGVIHRRALCLRPTHGGVVLEVEDTAESAQSHDMCSLIQLAPGIKVSPEGRDLCLGVEGESPLAVLVPGPGVESSVGSSPYCPDFGVRLPRARIELTARSSRTPLRYAIHLHQG